MAPRHPKGSLRPPAPRTTFDSMGSFEPASCFPVSDHLPATRGALEQMLQGALSNQRIKLSRRGGHFWWYAQWKSFFLIVAAPTRSLCAIR